MTKTAAVAFEVRWRKNVDPANQWSTPVSVGADGHVKVPGLERVTDYTFEARAISGCGAKSAWATQTLNLPDVSAGTLTLDDLSSEVTAAQTAADTANNQLAAIASDNVLSPAEKPVAMREYSVITTDQSGVDAQADAYGVSRTAYDSAISALTSYLATLTTPKAWNDKSGNTTIVGTTFRAKFNAVYTAQRTLLNAIYAAAKQRLDTNQPLVNNPYFSTGDLTGWTSDHGTVVFESGSNGPASASAAYARRNGSSGTPSEALRNTARIPVYPGAVIKAQCAIRGIGTPNGAAGVRISWRDATDTEIGTTQGSTTTGNATNGTYVTGTAPAGAFFAHVECIFVNHTTGSYTVDNFWASALADSMDQVPDGTTRFGAVEAGADKTSGKPLSSLSGRTADYIGETATKKWAGETGATVGANWGTNLAARPTELTDGRIPAGMDNTGALVNGVTPLSRLGTRTLDYIGDSATRFAASEAGADKTAGKSLTVLTDRTLDNVSDTSAYMRGIQYVASETVDNASFEASAATPPPGWSSFAATLDYATGSDAYTGARSLKITATAANAQAFAMRRYKCSAGQIYRFSAAASGSSLAAWALVLVFVNSATGANSTVVAATIPQGATSWAKYAGNVTVPSGFDYFQIKITSSVGTSGSQCWVDDVALALVRDLDTQVQDGTTYGRVGNADIVQSGGINRIGLRVPGSGQTIGDQRNLQPITWASQRSVLSTSPISYSISGTTVSFSVSAFTLMGGGISLNYGASSGSVTQSAGTTTTWFLYYRDAAQAGGSLPLNITTNPGGAASWPDSIFLGTAQVTVNSGGGGTGGTGGGGGGYCVADDMFIGEGRRAGDAEIGDPFDCIDLPTQAGKHVRALQGLTRGTEECVRMITSDGCALVCSISTPFDLPDGRSATAPHMIGEQVITDLGVATVISLALVGPRPVTRAHLGGVSYAAGADPARRIYSHNAGSINKP